MALASLPWFCNCWPTASRVSSAGFEAKMSLSCDYVVRRAVKTFLAAYRR
jgi:hypothetical protein